MADTGQKISELAAASPLDGTELVPVVQGGSTKKSTAAAVGTLVKTGLSKSDVGLGNVDNVRQYSALNPPSAADVGAVPISRTVNGKALSSDVTLDASDVGAEEELTWDNSPTEGSANPVKSGGIYDALLKLYPTDTASGDVASFPDGADGVPVQDLTVRIEPVQSGSGDPSPTNIRPISGWTSATVTRTGKNVIPMTVDGIKAEPLVGTWDGNSWTYNGLTLTIETDGDGNVTGIIANGTVTRALTFPVATRFALENGANYIVTGCPAGGSTSTYFTYCDTTGVTWWVDLGTGTTITSTGMTSYLIRFVAGTYNNLVFRPMIRLASDLDSTFEPYVGDEYTVSWQSAAGTVYGGALDVTTGVLTVTDGQIASYAGETLPGEWISDRDAYAAGTSPSTGAQVVYKLASATTYQLTPTEVTTLLGTNNIWADCGPVDVDYRADPTLYINKHVQALTALMSEL